MKLSDVPKFQESLVSRYLEYLTRYEELNSMIFQLETLGEGETTACQMIEFKRDMYEEFQSDIVSLLKQTGYDVKQLP